MGLIDKIKRGSGEDETIEYQCMTCHTTFESPHTDVGEVNCQDCGSPNVRTA